MKSRIDDVKEKLQELKDGSNDATHLTPDILRNIATFVEDELEDLIRELGEIANDVESMEEQNEELESKVNDLELRIDKLEVEHE